MMTDPEGDGRFLGKVLQIVKFGDLECLNPGTMDLDVLLEKELGIKASE